LKILILTGNYPRKNAPGNGIFIHQQVKALQQLGAECHVLSLHNWFPPFGLHRFHSYWREGHKSQDCFYEEFEGVKIHSVPMFVKMPSSVFKDNYYDRAARSIIKYVKNNHSLHNADWLYAHFLTDNGYIGAKVKDELKVKLAAISRGDDVHAWPVRFPALQQHFPLVFQKADLLLANSMNLAKDVQKWMQPGNMRNVETIYNGIDHVKFHPVTSAAEKQALRSEFGIPADKKILVCVATAVALKGWLELLQAIKILGKQFNGWQLLMVAPPRLFDDAIDLMKEGKALGVEDKILHIPGLSPDSLASVLAVCDAFVLPSYNEGMANALLEAMACGLACVATDVGGHNEVIENAEEGILVPPRSVDALAAAIRTMTDSDELRKKMGVKARTKMIAFGDYLYNSGKLLALFQKDRK